MVYYAFKIHLKNTNFNKEGALSKFHNNYLDLLYFHHALKIKEFQSK